MQAGEIEIKLLRFDPFVFDLLRFSQNLNNSFYMINFNLFRTTSSLVF